MTPNTELKKALQTFLAGTAPDLKQGREVLIGFKNKGIGHQEAYDTLQDIRTEYEDSAVEPLILDLMDIAWGFCSEPLRVWDETLESK
jgi:hypothetical protein